MSVSESNDGRQAECSERRGGPRFPAGGEGRQPVRSRANVAETTQSSVPPEGHKKLPGLWLLCVFLGTTGLACLGVGVDRARTEELQAGILTWAVATVPCLLGAVGLWVRSKVARIAMMTYFASLVFVLIGACTADRNPVQGLVPFGPIVALFAACWKYLWDVRPYFGLPPDKKPPIWSLAALAALLLVFALGLPALLWLATLP